MAAPTAQLTINLASVGEQVVTAVKDSMDKIGNYVVSASKPPDPDRLSDSVLREQILGMLAQQNISIMICADKSSQSTAPSCGAS